MKRTEELHLASREIFGGLAPSYERTLDLATLLQDRRWKIWVLDAFKDRGSRGGRCLDVGCGTLLLEQDRRLPATDVVGLDLSREMLMVGKQKSLPRVALIEGDAEALPYPESVFDMVVSMYVAKYVDAERFVRELARVTKPGGVIALYDFTRPTGLLAPALGVYVYGALRMAGLLMELAGRAEATTFSKLPGIVRTAYWDAGLQALMRANGFSDVKERKFVGGIVHAYSAVRVGDGAVGECPSLITSGLRTDTQVAARRPGR